jgi:hypothetical protein
MEFCHPDLPGFEVNKWAWLASGELCSTIPIIADVSVNVLRSQYFLPVELGGDSEAGTEGGGVQVCT